MNGRLGQQQALRFWQGALAESLRRGGPDLTVRQMAILLTVYMTPPPHTVRGLAAGLRVSKPAVSRALDVLERLALARRKPDEADRRSILVQRTVKGSVFLADFAEIVGRAARDAAGQ